jgi:hypothetical protein
VDSSERVITGDHDTLFPVSRSLKRSD